MSIMTYDGAPLCEIFLLATNSI